MIRRARASVLAFPLLLAATAAPAIDLDALSASDRRIYCYAYVMIDLNLREKAGLVDAGEVQREANRMSGAIYRREGNLSAGVYQRRLNRAFATIVAEDPSPQAFAAQVGICRALFRL